MGDSLWDLVSEVNLRLTEQKNAEKVDTCLSPHYFFVVALLGNGGAKRQISLSLKLFFQHGK